MTPITPCGYIRKVARNLTIEQWNALLAPLIEQLGDASFHEGLGAVLKALTGHESCVLVAFAEAVTLGDEAGMANARKALQETMGDAALVDAAGIVGMFIGGALIDRSFRFPLDIRYGLDLPVLAQVPNANLKPKPWWRFW